MSGGERILVTGASGYLARRLVPLLVARGHAVKALVRGGAARAAAVAHLKGCEIAAGDVTDAASCAAAARDCTAVVHLVGIIRERGTATFERVHVGGTRAVVDAARAAGATRVLYVSAIGARPDAPSAYGRTKAMAEQIVRSSGLTWIVLRPSIVLARDGEFFGVLRSLTAFPLVPVLGPGTSRIAPILAFDLAEILARAFELPEQWNRVHTACGPRAYAFDDLLRMAARGRGRSVVLVHVPLALARPLVALARVLGPLAPVTPDQLEMLNEDSTCDANAIASAFGVVPGPIESVFDDAVHRMAA